MSKRKSTGSGSASSVASQPSVRRFFKTSDGKAHTSTRPSESGASVSVNQNTLREDPSSGDDITAAEMHVHREEVHLHSHPQSTMSQSSSQGRNSRDTQFVVIFCPQRCIYLIF